MTKLLIIADDFTGALDTGVQFAARGAATCVVTDLTFDFTQTEAEVLVLDAETRHLNAEEAYGVVYQVVQAALKAGCQYIYKKTDSCLRGNVGAELTAVLDAAGMDTMPFLPAFPKMNRVTKNGIHYIDGVPVTDSVFGKDPFEPVRQSSVAELIGWQSSAPVILHRFGEECETLPGIQLYDAQSDKELEWIGRQLGQKGLRLSAGCAGFAAVLAEILGLEGSGPEFPKLKSDLFIVCGSVNPVTIRQMQTAEEAGFPHIHLKPHQKLDPAWPESPEGREEIQSWLTLANRNGCYILDVNDSDGEDDTAYYARLRGLTVEDTRIQIASQLGLLMKLLLDAGLDATILCTGGDTLLALMRAVDVAGLIPVCEMAPGVVLNTFQYRDKQYHIISKSGGFGEPGLFCELAARIRAKINKEGCSHAYKISFKDASCCIQR